MALKPCQGCKTEVDTTAKSCPKCGRPDPAALPTSKIWKIVLPVLAIGALIKICSSIPSPESRESVHRRSAESAAEPKEERSAPTIQISAMSLYKAYDENEVAADEQYKGKRLLISGTVTSIDKDFLDNIVLVLKGPNQFMGTHATLEKSEKSGASSLHKGDSVTLACTCKGRIVGSPSLGDCAFAH